MLGEFYGRVCNLGTYTISPSHEFNWPPIKYNNFQKLRYFGLITKSENKGFWTLTHRGSEFIKGKIKVQEGVVTFRNKIIDHYGEEVNVVDVWKNNPYVERYDYSSSVQMALI